MDLNPRLDSAGPPQLSAENLGAGQSVTVVARWILIAVGLAITLWSPAEYQLGQVKTSVFVLLALAVGNFYLHAQLLMDKPIDRWLLYGASAVDLAAVTVLTWLLGGLAAPVYVFYYPAVLALALVFPVPLTAMFTASLVGVYLAVAMPRTPAEADLQLFVARAIALVGVAVVAAVYQRVERDRLATLHEQLPQPVDLLNRQLAAATAGAYGFGGANADDE